IGNGEACQELVTVSMPRSRWLRAAGRERSRSPAIAGRQELEPAAAIGGQLVEADDEDEKRRHADARQPGRDDIDAARFGVANEIQLRHAWTSTTRRARRPLPAPRRRRPPPSVCRSGG